MSDGPPEPVAQPTSPLLRLCDESWEDPVDPSFAAERGGRWNPPGSWPTLYFNDDWATVRANLRRLFSGSRVHMEDLADDAPYAVVEVELPGGQRFTDLRDGDGLSAVGLPVDYPLDAEGGEVSHARCQRVGQAVHASGDADGLLVRSAATHDGTGRETVWFVPDDARADVRARHAFATWRRKP